MAKDQAGPLRAAYLNPFPHSRSASAGRGWGFLCGFIFRSGCSKVSFVQATSPRSSGFVCPVSAKTVSKSDSCFPFAKRSAWLTRRKRIRDSVGDIMKRFELMALAAMLALAPIAGANAATIVDTGPGPNVTTGGVVAPDQFLAAEFETGAAKIVTIEGWISALVNNTNLRVALYSDGGAVPGAVLFQTSFAANPSTGWQGVSGLNWEVGPGAYWVAFEGISGRASMSFPVSDPLDRYAFTPGIGQPYQANPSSTFGVRILGAPTGAVPEPSTWATMLLGLFGLGAALRSRRSKQRAAISFG